MIQHPELVCAYRLNGQGGGEPLKWPDVSLWKPDQGVAWVHLDAAHEKTEAWLRNQSALSTFVIDGLLASETRPRCEGMRKGFC